MNIGMEIKITRISNDNNIHNNNNNNYVFFERSPPSMFIIERWLEIGAVDSTGPASGRLEEEEAGDWSGRFYRSSSGGWDSGEFFLTGRWDMGG